MRLVQSIFNSVEANFYPLKTIVPRHAVLLIILSPRHIIHCIV